VPDGPTRKPEFRDEEDSRENVSDDMIEEKTDEESRDAPRLTGLPEIPTGDDLKFDLDTFSFMTPTSEV
jgi:hypothetical protein